MKIKKRVGFNRLLLLLIPALISADDLKSLLEFGMQNNSLVSSTVLVQEAKAKELDASENSYYPTLDVGAFYQSTNERTFMQPGDIYSGYAKLSFDIYDGGRKSSLVEQKELELESSSFESEAMKKSLSLQIVRDFYTIENLEANLMAYEESKKSIQAQLQRIEKFYEAKLATKDDVDRLQSALDTNVYEIEVIKYQILSVKKYLELKVGKTIDTLEGSKFKELTDSEYELVDSTKALQARKSAVLSGAESIDSVYYPQIRIEDTYSMYGYERTDTLHPEGVDSQNKLMLSLNMRLFDMGTISKTKESILINAKSLNTQIEYKKQEQKVEFELAVSAIETSRLKIKSAKSALVSATSAFKTIDEKYNAGIVDNVVYLDALTAQTRAQALHKTSLNDLEMAYAMYYYYSGKNIEEFLQ